MLAVLNKATWAAAGLCRLPEQNPKQVPTDSNPTAGAVGLYWMVLDQFTSAYTLARSYASPWDASHPN
jgi:hypothetical protein